MAGSGAALTRASGALSKIQSLSTGLASRTTGADGASHIASSDTVGGALWTTMTGFVNALLGGAVSASAPTRAQMIANQIPAAVTTIQTSGYALPGDGGAAIYVRSAVALTDGSSFQSAEGAWWQIAFQIHMHVKMFGAVGGNAAGPTDDTAALLAASAFMKAHCWNAGGSTDIKMATLHLGAGRFKLTKSVDFTSSGFGSSLGFNVVGDGPYSTIIYSHLTEAYPVLDFSGNSHSAAKNLAIFQQAGCMATAGLARLSVPPDPLGYEAFDEDLNIQMLTCPGIVSTVDLHKLNRIWSQGTYGGVFGGGSGLGIASKFQTVISNSDLTMLRLNDCTFLGGLPLYLTGCNSVLATGCYMTPVAGYTNPITIDGGVAAGVVINPVIGTVGLGNYQFIGCRTENQDNSGARNIMHCFAISPTSTGVGSFIYSLDISGVFENTSAAGQSASSSIVYTNTNGSIGSLKINGQAGGTLCPVLKLTGPCGNTSYDIKWMTAIPLGTVSGKTSSRVDLGVVFTPTDFNTLSNAGIGSVAGNYNSYAQKSITDWAFSPASPATVVAECAAVNLAVVNTAYVGGSGTATVSSVTVPANILHVTPGRMPRSLDIELPIQATGAYTQTLSLMVTGNAVGGGTVTATIATIALTTQVSGKVRCVLRNIASTTGQLGCYAEFLMGTQSAAGVNNSVSTLDWTQAFTVNLLVNSDTAAAVLVSGFITGLLR